MDIAGMVLFLASDLSAMTTGQTMMVDGGTVLL
jgi:enoyl-[acyl-carrier-protein] reductase (NADH)